MESDVERSYPCRITLFRTGPYPEQLAQVAFRRQFLGDRCPAVIVRTAPALFLLYHAIKIFSSFAKGAVFATKPIAHIRAAGFWTIIWAFGPSAAQFILEHHIRMKFEPALLAFGIATFIAAHVMGEARRIAEENASIL
jgi:hypothetical protein